MAIPTGSGSRQELYQQFEKFRREVIEMLNDSSLREALLDLATDPQASQNQASVLQQPKFSLPAGWELRRNPGSGDGDWQFCPIPGFCVVYKGKSEP